MSTTTEGRQPEHLASPRRPRRRPRHDSAIMQAEVHRLAQGLASFGILHHDQLREVTGANHWQEGGFEVALDTAVREGVIDRLPGDFYRDATHLHSAE